MEELFKKEYVEAENKLNTKGYYVCNMGPMFNGAFEIYKGENVVMDHLSLAQLLQLSDIL